MKELRLSRETVNMDEIGKSLQSSCPYIRKFFCIIIDEARAAKVANYFSRGRGRTMTSDAVRAYYASFGEREWERLENPADGAVEFAITCHTLASHLPPSARVLDIGGGPGRYTVWLAQRGHRVVLADLSRELLAIAKAKIEQAGAGAMVEEIVEANACDTLALGR